MSKANSKIFSPALKFAGSVGTVGGFIADVLSPLGPVLKFLFYTSLTVSLISISFYFISKSNLKSQTKKIITTSLFFTLIFGLFFQLNKGTQSGLLGDNIEFINKLQNSMNIIDDKLDDISSDIKDVSEDIKDVKEIITGDAELKNMSSSEDLKVTKELNDRTLNLNAKRIAILYFSNSGENKKLNMLKKGLADMMISDLSNINMLNIVERDQIEKIVKEQKLSNTSDFDPETATKIGKLLGAEIILTGAYFEMFGSLRLDARLIDVSTGKILKSDGVDGESSKFFKIQKQLSWKIIKNLDAKISNQEIKEFEQLQNNKAISFDDAQKFSRALDLYDNNKKDESIKIVKEILNKYPEFNPAIKLLKKLT